MKNKIFFLIAIPCVILYGCKPKYCSDVLIKKDTTVEAERNNTLFAFVGEKIEVRHIPSQKATFDSKFFGRYIVLQKIYGCYLPDTIEFIAYDHYGWPEFSKYKNVLLYLSLEDGKYYHEKYQYDNVYLTKSGKWAGVYHDDYEDDCTRLNIVPKRTDFADSLIFPIKVVYEDGTVIWNNYPFPFYKTVGTKAIADYGISVEDLFKIKKYGVLAARGLFKAPEETEGPILQDVQLEEVGPEEARMSAYWVKFSTWVANKDYKHLKQALFDSLWVCGSLFTKEKLLAGCFNEIFDSTLVAGIKKHTYTDYDFVETNIKDLLPCARKRILKRKEGYAIRQLKIFTYENVSREANLYLGFINTKQGLRLYDIRYPGNHSCCF